MIEYVEAFGRNAPILKRKAAADKQENRLCNLHHRRSGGGCEPKKKGTEIG
jgi:hypothetical protein